MRAPGLKLSQRDRRALVIGALLLAPVVAWKVVVRPYISAVVGTREQLRVQRDLLTRELDLLAAAERYPDALARAERSLGSVASKLFTGPDDVSATAALAYYVSDQARKSRVVVQQVETRNSEPIANGVIGLDMALRAEGDVEGLVTLLRRLESGPKLVRVEQITVEQGGGHQLGVGAALESESLSIAASIRGYAPARADSADSVAAPRASRGAQRGSE